MTSQAATNYVLCESWNIDMDIDIDMLGCWGGGLGELGEIVNNFNMTKREVTLGVVWLWLNFLEGK